MLLMPSSTVAVVAAPASRDAMDRLRAVPVINNVMTSTIGPASQATTTSDGTAEKLYCVVHRMTASE